MKSNPRGWSFAACAVLLLTASVMVHLAERRVQTQAPPPLSRSLNQFGDTLGAWRSIHQGMEPEIASALRLLDYWSATYVKHVMSDGVAVFIGYYPDQATAKLHKPTICYPGAGWTQLREEKWKFRGNAGEIEANFLLFGNEGLRQVVVYWFQLPGGGAVADPTLEKMRYLTRVFPSGGGDPTIKVQLATAVIRDEAEARARLEELSSKLTERLDQILGPEWSKRREPEGTPQGRQGA